MTVKWMRGYGNGNRGFAPVSSDNKQLDVIHHCKEVFAHRFVEWKGRLAIAGTSEEGTIKFLYRNDMLRFSPEFIQHKLDTIHTLERAMKFKPLAKITLERDPDAYGGSYLLFEVSASWAASHPVIHILAIFVRNQYPLRGVMEWPTIIKWYRTRARAERVGEAMTEIISNRGKIRGDVAQGNGISDYARNRAEKLGE